MNHPTDNNAGQPDGRIAAVASNDRQTSKASDPEVIGDDLDAAAIMNALRGVIDSDLGDNIVDLGMVKRLERGSGGAMHITTAGTYHGRISSALLAISDRPFLLHLH